MLRVHGTGVSIALRVKPRGKRTRVTVGDGVLLVEVTAPPVEGAANEAVVAAVADALDLKKRQVVLIAGEGSRDKVVLVEECPMEELRRRIGLLATIP